MEKWGLMFFVRYSFHNLEIAGVEVKHVIDYIWENSPYVKKYALDKADTEIIYLDEMRLDPGGILNTKEEWKHIIIDGYIFELQLSKLSYILHRVKSANFEIPGCAYFPMYRWYTVLPRIVWSKLVKELETLCNTDSVLHAEITDFELKDRLEEGGYMVFPEIPRE